MQVDDSCVAFSPAPLSGTTLRLFCSEFPDPLASRGEVAGVQLVSVLECRHYFEIEGGTAESDRLGLGFEGRKWLWPGSVGWGLSPSASQL